MHNNLNWPRASHYGNMPPSDPVPAVTARLMPSPATHLIGHLADTTVLRVCQTRVYTFTFCVMMHFSFIDVGVGFVAGWLSYASL